MPRRRRRVYRRTEGPDRAWLIVDFGIEFDVSAFAERPLIEQSALLMTFEDITTDEANLSREKSEWFVQRLLIDWVPNMGALQSTDLRYSKMYEHVIHTMNNRLVEETDLGAPQEVITDNVYNRAARVLHTGVNPLHAHWNPVISIAQNGELQTSGGDAGAAQVSLAVTPWLGKEHVSLDLSSKFGLREDTNLYVSYGPFLKSDLWPQQVDGVNFLGKARILVQRKRMR